MEDEPCNRIDGHGMVIHVNLVNVVVAGHLVEGVAAVVGAVHIHPHHPQAVIVGGVNPYLPEIPTEVAVHIGQRAVVGLLPRGAAVGSFKNSRDAGTVEAAVDEGINDVGVCAADGQPDASLLFAAGKSVGEERPGGSAVG